MSEQAVMDFAAESEPQLNEVDLGVGGEETSFSQAFEEALGRLENPVEEAQPEPQDLQPEPQDLQPESEVPQPEGEEESADPSAEGEEVQESEESENSQEDFDPTNDLETQDTADWTPKAARRFKQLKEERKVLRSEVDDLRQKNTEYESKIQELSGAVDNDDIEAMRDQLAEYEQQKMFTDLENTTSYRETVTEPLLELLNKAEQVADHYDIDSDVLIDVISMDEGEDQDEALSEILEDVSDRDKAKIYRVLEDINPILNHRTNMINNLEEAYYEAQSLEEHRQNQLAAQKAQERQAITRNVVGRVKEKVPFLAGFEGIDFDSITEKASDSDPAVIHPVDAAYNAVAAQMLPSLVKEYSALQAELESLTDRLAEYEEAEPGTSGSVPDSGRVANSAGANVSFEDAISQRLSGVS
jgi:hypothetical protein